MQFITNVSILGALVTWVIFGVMGQSKPKNACDDGFLPIAQYSVAGFPQKWVCVAAKPVHVNQ